MTSVVAPTFSAIERKMKCFLPGEWGRALHALLVAFGVIHLVRTHKGGRGVKQMRMNAYKGGGGLTHKVHTQSKNLSAFYIHTAIFSFAKVP